MSTRWVPPPVGSTLAMMMLSSRITAAMVSHDRLRVRRGGDGGAPPRVCRAEGLGGACGVATLRVCAAAARASAPGEAPGEPARGRQDTAEDVALLDSSGIISYPDDIGKSGRSGGITVLLVLLLLVALFALYGGIAIHPLLFILLVVALVAALGGFAGGPPRGGRWGYW